MILKKEIVLENSIDTIDEGIIRNMFKPRKISSRKGDNGITLVVGGNKLYHGAPILATLAALRTGTDLVFTAVPKSNLIPTRSFSPDFIVLPLADEKLTIGSSNKLLATIPKIPDSATIGMGMSVHIEGLKNLITKLLDKGTKLVLDASSLIPEILSTIENTQTVITPHGGEYMRMFQEQLSDNIIVQASNVKSFAKKYQITIVLKGYNNIISDGENTVIIKRSTPAMTVGGIGDILAGLIGGMLTKNSPLESSILGVFLNGKACLNTFKKFGLHIMASDVIDELPRVMKDYDKIDYQEYDITSEEKL